MKTFSPFRWKWTRPAFPSRTFPSLSLCLEHHLISFLAHVCLRRGDMEQSWVMFTHCSGVALDNRIPPWVTVVLLSSSRLGGSRPNPVALLAMESVPLVLPWVCAAVPCVCSLCLRELSSLPSALFLYDIFLLHPRQLIPWQPEFPKPTSVPAILPPVTGLPVLVRSPVWSPFRILILVSMHASLSTHPACRVQVSFLLWGKPSDVWIAPQEGEQQRRENGQVRYSSVQFSRSVMSDSLRPHESQQARPPCPSPTPGVYSNSCPLSRWCHPAISPSVIPFFSCQSGSFPGSQLFAWGGQSTGVSAPASVLPMNTQDSSALGWTGWISLQSKGLSRVFPNTTVQNHQFFSAQLSSQSNSHIHTWPLEKP